MTLFILTIKVKDVQVIAFTTSISLLAKHSGDSFISRISGWQPLFQKNADTTGPSVFAVGKTFPSRVPGLMVGLPVPLGTQDEDKRFVTVTQMHVSLNPSTRPAVSGTQSARARLNSHQHPSKGIPPILAAPPYIPFYAAAFCC